MQDIAVVGPDMAGIPAAYEIKGDWCDNRISPYLHRRLYQSAPNRSMTM